MDPAPQSKTASAESADQKSTQIFKQLSHTKLATSFNSLNHKNPSKIRTKPTFPSPLDLNRKPTSKFLSPKKPFNIQNQHFLKPFLTSHNVLLCGDRCIKKSQFFKTEKFVGRQNPLPKKKKTSLNGIGKP